ncbi:MAG: hypothetical protein D6B28_09500 [Gammaproteobacteria bacterium]|nr:MAG: hypothetical protein D6B28_09500 [Gammaproteobacteria bacterium]
MSLPVNIKEVLEALIYTEDDCTTYVNKVTGELATISDEESNYAHQKLDETVPEWIVAGTPRVKQILESEDFLEMPSKYDLHEENIRKTFCETIEKEDVKNYLLKTLNGKHAEDNFTKFIDEFDLNSKWVAHRDNSMKEIATNFLDEHSIPYQD